MATVQGRSGNESRTENSQSNQRSERAAGNERRTRGRRETRSVPSTPAAQQTQDAAVVNVSPSTGQSTSTPPTAPQTGNAKPKFQNSVAGANVVNIAVQGGREGQGGIAIFGSGNGPGAVTPKATTATSTTASGTSQTTSSQQTASASSSTSSSTKVTTVA